MPKHVKILLLVLLVTCCAGIYCGAAESGPGSRFVASGDDTVLDTQTGLMWAAEDNGADTNWEAAKKYCENYSGGGHTDWRLPTLKELGTIYDPASEKRFRTISLITLSGSCPWSSEERRKRARTLFFMSGEINTFPKKSAKGFRALPVRTDR